MDETQTQPSGKVSKQAASAGLKALLGDAKKKADDAANTLRRQANQRGGLPHEESTARNALAPASKAKNVAALADKAQRAEALADEAKKKAAMLAVEAQEVAALADDAQKAVDLANDALKASAPADKAEKAADLAHKAKYAAVLANKAKMVKDLADKAQNAVVTADKAELAALLAKEKTQLLNLEQPSREETPNDCPVSQYPPVVRELGTFLRPSVANDFLVLEYNADPTSLKTRWYDYRQMTAGHPRPQWNDAYTIERNGTFLPVVWAKEKILVHVCGLHFTDIVTVSNDSTGLPEGGADIRGGAAVTTVPTLTPALDSIQAIGATGQAATIGGLGFSATPALASAAATGITNGTVSRGPTGLTYNDATITTSPEELALMMYALIRNGMNLSESIQKDFVLDIDVMNTPYGYQTYLPTSFDHIALEAKQRLDEVSAHAMDETDQTNPAEFDRDMTNVQNLSTEMTNFFGALSSQGYGARAVTLWGNYAVLRAPLNMMEDHIHKNNCIPSTEAQATSAAADVAAETAVEASIAEAAAWNKLQAAPVGSPNQAALQGDYNAKKVASQNAAAKLTAAQTAAIAKAGSTTPSNQLVNCDDWETNNYVEFLKEYKARLNDLAASDPGSANAVLHWHPVQMFQDLHDLQENIVNLADTVGDLYSVINIWNDNSEAEQSDFITPVAGNALERISISVQHGYVPFTLASYATSTAPTVTTPAAPTITTTASTSIPAHTVKTILVEVHRRANLNLIGGAMFFKVPTSTYAVQTGTTPSTLVSATPTPVMTPPASPTSPPIFTYTFVFDGICNDAPGVAGTTVDNVPGTVGSTTPPNTPTPPTTTPGYTCVVQTQTGNTQLAGMVGVDWFVMGRDYFPLRNGAGISRRNFIPAVYAATSVTSPGNSSFGLNLEPFSGVDFLIGAGMAHTTVLPSGVTTSTVLPSGYTLPTVTQVNWGLTFGFGFDLSVFSQIFSKGPSSASLP